MDLENRRLKFQMGDSLHVQVVKVFDRESWPVEQDWLDAGWSRLTDGQLNSWTRTFVNFEFLPEDFELSEKAISFEKIREKRHINIFHMAPDEEIEREVNILKVITDRMSDPAWEYSTLAKTLVDYGHADERSAYQPEVWGEESFYFEDMIHFVDDMTKWAYGMEDSPDPDIFCVYISPADVKHLGEGRYANPFVEKYIAPRLPEEWNIAESAESLFEIWGDGVTKSEIILVLNQLGLTQNHSWES